MPDPDRGFNVNASWGRTSNVALLVLCAVFAGPAFAAPKPTAALIELDKNAVTGLLESRLLANDSVRWVERTEIDRVLKEQQFQDAFGAAGVKERSSLGKLLKADLLILVRETDSLDKKTRVIECVVCETKQGLRMRVAAVPLDKETEKTAAALEAVAQAGLKKSREDIKDIVSVSPLVSDDLGFQYNYLQTAYAKIIEQVLLDVPGLVVVELGEAQAIAKELAIGGENAVQRQLRPLNVLGRFRHTHEKETTTVSIELRTLRGTNEIYRNRREGLSFTDAGPWLLQESAELRKLVATRNGEEATAQEQARQLTSRAEEFLRIGNWEEAVAVLEASLLLDPQQQAARRHICVAISRIAAPLSLQSQTDPAATKQLAPLFRQGMKHLEEYLRRAGRLPDWRQSPDTEFVGQMTHSFYAGGSKSRPGTLEAGREFNELREQELLRLAEIRARQGCFEDGLFPKLMGQIPNKETALAVATKFVNDLADSEHVQRAAIEVASERVGMFDYPIIHTYVDRLRQSNQASVREAAEEVARRLAKAPKPFNNRSTQTSPDPATTILSPLKLEPAAFSADRHGNPVLGCQSLGPGCDVFWTADALCIMRNRDRLERLWVKDRQRIDQVVWDGRWIWLALEAPFEPRDLSRSAPPSLLAIDPDTKRQYTFTAKDGFPSDAFEESDKRIFSGQLHLAILQAGKICVIGSARRTWFAVASVSHNGDKQLRVFHEAREIEDEQPMRTQSISTGFKPTYLATLSGQERYGKPGYRVLVGRALRHAPGREIPLLIDPLGEHVEVANFTLQCGQKQLAVKDGEVFFLDGIFDTNTPRLGRIQFPGTKEVLIKEAHRGLLLADREAVHLVGNQWSRIDPNHGTMTVLAPVVPWVYADSPKYPSPQSPAFGLESVGYSSHYGLVAFANQGPRPFVGKVFRLEPLDKK